MFSGNVTKEISGFLKAFLPERVAAVRAQTDYSHMAMAAGPLDVPLGPLQALSTVLPNDNSPLAAETESILKNLRSIQEQVLRP